MINREHYEFNKFKNWDSELNDAAKKFNTKFGMYPNIMLANDQTYQAIEEAANVMAPKNFFGLKGDKVITKPFSELGGIDAFSTKDFYIEFCSEKGIPFTGFALIYDSKAQIQDTQKSLGIQRVWTVR